MAAYPNPPLLYFTVSYSITEEAFQEYLQYSLQQKVGWFRIVQLESKQGNTEIEVLFESLNKARRALKILIKGIPEPHAGFDVSLTKCSKSPQLLQNEIELFKSSIERKYSYYIEQHQGKVQELASKQSKLQIPQKCTPDQYFNLKEERTTLDERITECQHQKGEFMGYCDSLLRKLDHLSSSSQSTNKTLEAVTRWRKDFGRECSRFLKALPIYAKRQEIIETIQLNQVTILIGETGSGKSTQIVQYLFDAGFGEKGIIPCTQPRKVAAVTLATHVSREMDAKLGTTLGYKVGMHGTKYSTQTKVLYMTDHTLLNECIADQNFSKYSCLVIDEAHERSLHTDLLLALIKKCLPRRRDLKVVITSATINPKLFIQYFGHCPVVRVSGRTFPVDVVWNPLGVTEPLSSRDYVSDAIEVVKKIHHHEVEQGDILVFLTSAVEIERACQTTSSELGNAAVVLPLHGRLPPEDQQKVFHDYPGKQKIIFTTNVAETSVTISGVKYIIDTGLAKELCFDPKRNMNSLIVRAISKSSAEQRKGRAGRTSAGKCFRLYSEEVYKGMPERTLPEILRVHLSHAALKLYEFGIANILEFDFVEHPDQVALTAAVETLGFLKAVSEGKLTDLGQKMATLPLDPQLSKVLLDGIETGIGLEAAVAVSISSLGGSVFFRGGTDEMKVASDKKKVEFCRLAGDQMTCLYVYKQWNLQEKIKRNQWCVDNYINTKSMRITDDTVKELREILNRNFQIPLPTRGAIFQDAEAKLPKLFFEAFIRNTSVFLGHDWAGYMTEKVPKESLVIFPGSALRQLNLAPKYVVYEKTLKTSQHFMIQVLPVEEEWVREAVTAGKLPCDPAEKFREYMVSPMTIANVGQYVLREAISKNMKDVREELVVTCKETPHALDLSRDHGVVRVFSQSRYHLQVQSKMQDRLNDVRETLKKMQFESGVTRNEDDVRLVMGLGGVVQHVLMPYHYRCVVAKGPPDSSWVEDVITSLTQFGEIEKYVPKIFERECRLFVTFCSPTDAAKALATLKTPERIVIEPQLRYKSGETGSKFTLKIEWCRRKRQNCAFIDFNSPEDVAIARSLVNTIVVAGSCVKLRPSKTGNNQLFATNVGIQVSEEELKNAVESQVLGVDIKAVKLGHEKSFETTREKLAALKHQLQMLVAKNATEGRFTVNIPHPKNFHMKFLAYVTFQDPDEGQRALNGLRLEQMEANPLEVKPSLSSCMRYPNHVYRVIEDAVKEVKSQLQLHYKESVKIVEKPKPNTMFIEIKSDDANAFIRAKNALNTVMQPDVIECQNPPLRQFVVSQHCWQILQEIQPSTSTYIYLNLRTMTINIYGTEANRTRAKVMLNERLNVLSGAACYELKLKAPGRPPGLMKHIVSQFAPELQGLMNREGIKGATLDPRRHILTVLATSEAHSSLLQVVEDYCTKFTASTTQENEVECCVCFTGVENPSEVIRLEYCGHPYCLECIQLQIAPTTASFPLECAAENCSQQFVWQDFQNLFKRTSFTLRQLTAASLKSYLNANKQTVRNCPTPNCDMVYVVSDDGKRFICSHCSFHYCTKCHVQYHDGLSCAMFQAGKLGDKEFKEWMRQDPQNRKQCPKCVAPIEKISGCNNVCCTHCNARICWVCLQYFDSDQDCYRHLHGAHGGFA